MSFLAMLFSRGWQLPVVVIPDTETVEPPPIEEPLIPISFGVRMKAFGNEYLVSTPGSSHLRYLSAEYLAQHPTYTRLSGLGSEYLREEHKNIHIRQIYGEYFYEEPKDIRVRNIYGEYLCVDAYHVRLKGLFAEFLAANTVRHGVHAHRLDYILSDYDNIRVFNQSLDLMIDSGVSIGLLRHSIEYVSIDERSF